jgi:hypothetical protein
VTSRERKTVNVGGLTWTIISANERSTSHNGRHFFACRCNPKTLWLIEELNQAQVHGSRAVGTVAKNVLTKALSLMVLAVTSQSVAHVAREAA